MATGDLVAAPKTAAATIAAKPVTNAAAKAAPTKTKTETKTGAKAPKATKERKTKETTNKKAGDQNNPSDPFKSIHPMRKSRSKSAKRSNGFLNRKTKRTPSPPVRYELQTSKSYEENVLERSRSNKSGGRRGWSLYFQNKITDDSTSTNTSLSTKDQDDMSLLSMTQLIAEDVCSLQNCRFKNIGPDIGDHPDVFCAGRTAAAGTPEPQSENRSLIYPGPSYYTYRNCNSNASVGSCSNISEITPPVQYENKSSWSSHHSWDGGTAATPRWLGPVADCFPLASNRTSSSERYYLRNNNNNDDDDLHSYLGSNHHNEFGNNSLVNSRSYDSSVASFASATRATSVLDEDNGEAHSFLDGVDDDCLLLSLVPTNYNNNDGNEASSDHPAFRHNGSPTTTSASTITTTTTYRGQLDRYNHLVVGLPPGYDDSKTDSKKHRKYSRGWFRSRRESQKRWNNTEILTPEQEYSTTSANYSLSRGRSRSLSLGRNRSRSLSLGRNRSRSRSMRQKQKQQQQQQKQQKQRSAGDENIEVVWNKSRSYDRKVRNTPAFASLSPPRPASEPGVGAIRNNATGKVAKKKWLQRGRTRTLRGNNCNDDNDDGTFVRKVCITTSGASTAKPYSRSTSTLLKPLTADVEFGPTEERRRHRLSRSSFTSKSKTNDDNKSQRRIEHAVVVCIKNKEKDKNSEAEAQQYQQRRMVDGSSQPRLPPQRLRPKSQQLPPQLLNPQRSDDESDSAWNIGDYHYKVLSIVGHHSSNHGVRTTTGGSTVALPPKSGNPSKFVASNGSSITSSSTSSSSFRTDADDEREPREPKAEADAVPYYFWDANVGANSSPVILADKRNNYGGGRNVVIGDDGFPVLPPSPPRVRRIPPKFPAQISKPVLQ